VSFDDGYRGDFVEHADVLFFSAANLRDPVAAAERLLEANPRRIVVVGMGAGGCTLGAAGRVRRFGPVETPEPVVDTNGAGDGLAVGFLSSFVLDGYSLEDSVRRGQIAARFTCALKASSSGLITREQLDERFLAGRPA
jgi:sugar/nucleoside kinase (ribokinase family)